MRNAKGGHYNVYCVRYANKPHEQRRRTGPVICAQEDHSHACKEGRVETNVQEIREDMPLEVALTNYPTRAFMMLRAMYFYRIAIAFFRH
jgi:hypothetical protein